MLGVIHYNTLTVFHMNTLLQYTRLMGKLDCLAVNVNTLSRMVLDFALWY